MKDKNLFLKFFSIIPFFVWQIIFIFIPILLLFFKGLFNINIINNFLWVCSTGFFKIILKSFIMSYFISWICLIIGYAVSYSLINVSNKFRNFFILLFTIPFLTNFFIHIMAWINILKNNGYLISKLKNIGIISKNYTFLFSNKAIILGYVYCYMPFMVLPLCIGLSKFNKNLIKASYDLGASKIKTFFRILVPETINSIITGFFLVFIPACGEFVIPEIMGGDINMYAGAALTNTLYSSNLINHASLMTIIFIILLTLFSYISYKSILKIIYILERI